MNSKITLLTILIFLNSTLSAKTNNPPIISPDFPDTVITKQCVSHKDSIFSLLLSDFGYDADADSLIWSTATEDSVVAFFSALQDTLYVHSKGNWYGRGKFTIKLADAFDGHDEKEVAVIAFKRNGTLRSADSTKTEYYIPWHPQLDFNRIRSVEQFLAEEGYREEALDRRIKYGRWKKMERLKDVTFTGAWWNELIRSDWSWNSQKMLIDYLIDELVFDNVNHVRIRDPFFIRDINSTEVFHQSYIDDFNSSDPTGGISLREFEWRYLINQLHNKGMGVSIVPFQDDFNFSRGGYSPSNWGTFFENYGDNILLPLARITYETGAEIFQVGETMINVSGTISNEDWNNFMVQKIKDARIIYPGPIGAFEELPPSGDQPIPLYTEIKTMLKAVDIMGCGSTSAYSYIINNFPLFNNPNTTYEDIYNFFIWHNENVISALKNVQDKPIMFFENGVPSVDSLFINWGKFVGGGSFQNPNMLWQELYYKAGFEARKNLDNLMVQGWYGWSFIPAEGGPKDSGLSPRGKPAEDVIRYYYGNGDNKKRVVEINGKIDDWKPEYLLIEDDLGDSKTDDYDLKAVYGTIDDMYLYLMIEVTGSLRNQPNKDLIGLNISLNGDEVADLSYGIIMGSDNKWQGPMGDDMSYTTLRALCDVEVDSTYSKFETQIPLRVLNYPQQVVLPRVSLGDLQDGVENDYIEGPVEINIPTNVNHGPIHKSDFHPKSITLFQSYPNPFNPSTTINFSIPKSSQVKITIYNIKGRVVKEFLDKKLSAGFHTINWDGKNKAGVEVSTGIYFYQLKTDTYTKTKKMLKIH